LTKGHDQENYLSWPLVTIIKRPLGTWLEGKSLDLLHQVHRFFLLVLTTLTIYCTYDNNFLLRMNFLTLWVWNCHKSSLVSFSFKFVRKYPSCKKVLREVKKIMKISLVNTNGKKRCSEDGQNSTFVDPCFVTSQFDAPTYNLTNSSTKRLSETKPTLHAQMYNRYCSNEIGIYRKRPYIVWNNKCFCNFSMMLLHQTFF
jgi:hypothetical protein